MRAQLKATIFRLHRRLQKNIRQRRRLKGQIRHRDAMIVKLQAQVRELQAITKPQPVFNCVYPAQMMALAVYIVLHGGPLRCAAATAGFYAEMMGWYPIRYELEDGTSNWVQRCGLHALKLTHGLKGEYVGILDASIQIGKEQLLLLLGVKADAASCGRPLCIEDVSVLGMEVQSSWTGAAVADFIRRNMCLRPAATLSYVICDQGTNLLAALRALGLPWVSDCSHVMMNLAKALFKDDKALSRLCAQVGTLRQQLALTDWSFALPPSLRDKGRFLRIFTLVEWMGRIDGYWPMLPASMRARLSFCRGVWLRLRLNQFYSLLAITASVLKSRGLSPDSYAEWRAEVNDYRITQHVMTRQATAFIAAMGAYFCRLYATGRFTRTGLCSAALTSSRASSGATRTKGA
ncbi:MAG: hypothetical protein H6557_23525 [Lewinellaceae bacterium]|nr:hypothetical protein [Lewinellaceae bacterium]